VPIVYWRITGAMRSTFDLQIVGDLRYEQDWRSQTIYYLFFYYVFILFTVQHNDSNQQPLGYPNTKFLHSIEFKLKIILLFSVSNPRDASSDRFILSKVCTG